MHIEINIGRYKKVISILLCMKNVSYPFVFIFQGTRDELESKLETSCTLYVGNLAFYTTEEQIYELFSKAGEVKHVIMGLDRHKKTPCGFCFVEYPFSISYCPYFTIPHHQ